MNKDGLFYRIASSLYKILICILAPICFLLSLIVWYKGVSRVINFVEHWGYDCLIDVAQVKPIEWIFLCMVAFVCAIISQQFIHIIWPKFSIKKVLVLFWFYYLIELVLNFIEAICGSFVIVEQL